MVGKPQAKNNMKIANSQEMQELVSESLKDIEHYSEMLAKADNPEEAKLRIKQLYFHNLKQAGQPLALSQKVLADLLTRVEVNRILGNDIDPLGRDYLKVLEEVRKTLKLVKDIEGKTVNIKVEKINDSTMNVLDSKVVDAMFNEGDK